MKNDKNFKRDAKKNELTEGREEIISRLLEENQERAEAFALSLIKDRDQARDLVQEAGLKVLRQGEKYDPLRSFSSWYLTVIRNAFLDGRRKEEMRKTFSLSGFAVAEGELSLEEILSDGEISAEERLEARENATEIMGAFERLPSRHQKVLTLCVIKEEGYAEAARKIGVSIGTVKSRMNRARKALSRQMKNKGESSDE